MDNMGIFLPVMVLVSFAWITPFLAFGLKKKSKKAFKLTLINGAAFSALSLVLVIFAVIFKGEPLIVFAVASMALLMPHLILTFKIFDVANQSRY